MENKNGPSGLDILKNIARKRQSGFVINTEELRKAQESLSERRTHANRPERNQASRLTQIARLLPKELKEEVNQGIVTVIVDYTGNLSFRR